MLEGGSKRRFRKRNLQSWVTQGSKRSSQKDRVSRQMEPLQDAGFLEAMQLLIQKNNELYQKQALPADSQPPFITQPTPFADRKDAPQLASIPSTNMAVHDLRLLEHYKSGV